MKVRSACQNLLFQKTTTIRSVAQVIGFLVSSFPAVEYAEMDYRHLELDKSSALHANKGNFDSIMALSVQSMSELTWWVMGLESLCGAFSAKHILVQSDNTTTVAYLNAMGGIKSLPCNEMATMIWDWCLKYNMWLSGTHIPGSKNIQADKESRVLKESTEWSLSQEVFNAIQERWGKCEIDLFASRLNVKVLQYVSWRHDPGAQFINVLLMNWKPHYFYAFPPFSLLATYLQKIKQDQSTSSFQCGQHNLGLCFS